MFSCHFFLSDPFFLLWKQYNKEKQNNFDKHFSKTEWFQKQGVSNTKSNKIIWSSPFHSVDTFKLNSILWFQFLENRLHSVCLSEEARTMYLITQSFNMGKMQLLGFSNLTSINEWVNSKKLLIKSHDIYKAYHSFIFFFFFWFDPVTINTPLD